MDWKSIIKTAAPVLGTALGGPLAGAAIKVLGDAVLGNADATQDEVAAAITSGLSPDAIVKMREADNAFKAQMKAMDIDILKLNAQTEAAYLEDVQSARNANGANRAVFWLGIAILITFATLMGFVMYGSFQLLTGGIVLKDVAVASVVSGLIGTVIGYVAGNAQQVVGYYFGSSKGSADKTDALASAVSKAVQPK